MAVVQISKIQVRRGQKNSNSGIPQLSSAEFAWAVDSQELFIGNGSVLEGAPYVGNTKVLTEHDNILDIASSYTFASTDSSITLSEPRKLQNKLDEYVSVLDFIPILFQDQVRLGATDCVAYFETAFSELFRNSTDKYKKVLTIPNGTYLFSSDLKIPSNTILRGETENGVILDLGINNIVLITSTGDQLVDFSSTNYPENIQVSNLTINRTTGQTVLSGLKNGPFQEVTFLGEYTLGDAVSSLTTEPAAVVWLDTLAGTKVTDVNFKSCTFKKNSISIKCNHTGSDPFETTVNFDDCKFIVNDTSIYIAGIVGQGNKWRINDCHFEEVANQAFRATQGRGTLIQRTKFKNCGNNTGTASTPTDSIVYFGDKVNNVLIDCTSNRHQAAAIVSSNTVASYPEVYGGDKAVFVDRNYSEIQISDSFRPLTVLSALNRYYKINYFLSLDVFSRVGTLTITVGDNLSQVSITDEYQYSPNTITPLTGSDGGAMMTNFEFAAELRDNDLDSGIDTIVLSYKNPFISGDTGTISFDITYGV
jgi:hypothetical protein